MSFGCYQNPYTNGGGCGPCYYGGYYKCRPYYGTQFQTVQVPSGVPRHRQPSEDLMGDADRLTRRGMYPGLEASEGMMRDSKETTDSARRLCQSFEEFSTDLGAFTRSARGFLSTINYPNFKGVINKAKPTFQEVGIWGSINEDFEGQMNSLAVLNEETSLSGCPRPKNSCKEYSQPRPPPPPCVSKQNRRWLWQSESHKSLCPGRQ